MYRFQEEFMAEENDDLFDVVPVDEDVSHSADIFDAAPDTEDAHDSHVEAAALAQEKADDAIAHGDYQAAAEHRETAENEAWQAGDNSMLHGSDSTQLETADFQHGMADYYQDQEQQHIASGDYEAAKEDASNAASYQSWSDQTAGGPDHTGEAKDQYNQMDWAVWEEHQGDADAHAAEHYAEQGDVDHADQYADNAAGHYDAADNHADTAAHTDVDTSHSYETTSTDDV
jgi:hypothetical protein